jgi:hypothetical protein
MVRRDADLGRVIIRCPLTGRSIPTGLTADPATWNSLRPHRPQQSALPRVQASPCVEQNGRVAEGPDGT